MPSLLLEAGTHPLLVAFEANCRRINGDIDIIRQPPEAEAIPLPPHAKEITLILLRDSLGSALFLCPVERIDNSLLFCPTLTVTAHELNRLNTEALAMAETRNLCGVTVFRYAITFDNGETMLLSVTQAISLQTLLIAAAQQLDLAPVAVGQLLDTHTHPPQPNYLSILNETTFTLADTVPRALLYLWHEQTEFPPPTVRRLSDGALCHGCAHSLPHATELLRRSLFDLPQISRMTAIDALFLHAVAKLLATQHALQATRTPAVIEKARRLGFPLAHIELLTQTKPRPRKTSFHRADTSFGTQPSRHGLFYPALGRNEVHLSIKPRMLLLGDIVHDPALTQAAQALHRNGYEVSLLSPYPTAAAIDRHYLQPINAETLTAVTTAERPRAVCAHFGGKPAHQAADGHPLLIQELPIP